MKSPIRELSLSDLNALGKAIRAGRLYPPFTSTSVQRYCLGSLGKAVAAELQRLYDEGTVTEHLAFFLEMLADERASQQGVDSEIDLVWTGPEGPGTASRDTSVVVRELFSGAKESVLVAGYAVYQGREIFRALADRMEELPDLRVQMFLDVQRRYGDTTKDSEILREFVQRFKSKEWPGEQMPDIYYDPRSLELESERRSSLHAKCIVIDNACSFVSSANFTEAAQVRNIEVGVLVQSEYFSAKLAHHFTALVGAGVLKPVPGI